MSAAMPVTDERAFTLGLIGGGVMAEALIAAVTSASLIRPENIVTAEVNEARRAVLRERYSVEVTANNLAAAGAEIVVLAVKPQQLGIVFQQLHGRVRKDAIVVSIVAGVRLPILIEGLEHELVVRAMPTTPARVGMSATFWIPSSGAGGAPALERVRALFGALGTQVQVADEAAVESATGLAGPMPAFLLSLVEAFVDAGVALGLPREQAALATIESMRGSLELLRRTQESPATLREQVTSPGGATLAGLRVLESAGVRDAMMAAVRAVYERAQELGRLPIAKRADH